MSFSALTALLLTGAALPTVPAPVTVDLATSAGLTSVDGRWRYQDARIAAVTFRRPAADGQPGPIVAPTFDIIPKAGGARFDDSLWPSIAPESLVERRGSGRLSFNWYRLKFTVPKQIGGIATDHAILVFRTSIDDYAEVWVDGELSRAPAQSGGSVVAGWNAVNRLVVSRDARPGQSISIAVFGANGPLSAPPTNYIWMREAKIEVYPQANAAEPVAIERQEVNVEVVRKDPDLDRIVPLNLKMFKLAEGFQFTEGPLWVEAPGGGHLLFSDPNANRIYRYSSTDGLAVFREKSGYDGADIGEYRQPGSNGLTIDPRGHLVINQHGRRRVVRLDGNREVVIADRYQGKRLNSPNDLIAKSDGAIYFTDPVFGLPKFSNDPRRELPFAGVFRAKDGKVTLLTSKLSGPNGIAFSPDEKHLYVGNWDDRAKLVMRYPVLRDGSIGAGTIFADLTSTPGEDAIDGVKVDRLGDVYVSGPGGLWIFAPDGRHLGTIIGPRHPHNMAWGGPEGRTLFLAAQDRLYEITLNIEGVRAHAR